ncbi:cytochrome C [Sphingomonas oleivorans]|uniref:Cytochrome C n=1 Tax=Sphingomonas oleivorans TaxID=1735121 RepID=A0A2T5FTL6_9SPHN|nr:c-type cytochrome [Sphingomonas oleivorans]PTQ07410.1 cytochrome C [Sphingomonas oleivorans]
MTLHLRWKHLIGIVATIVIGSMILAWSGLISVAASSGHWKISDWFLHWVMRNSVRTQTALSVDGAVSDDRALVAAAGHYAAACTVCHGAPGEPPSPLMRAATPPAPSLTGTADRWSERQHFWIIRHGVKYTGMPAWPAATREDEVRRMVAFVRRVGHMSPAEYRRLAYGTTGLIASRAVTLETALPDCARCHGDDGRGRGQRDIPILAGQDPRYLASALAAFRSGARPSAVMQTAATRIDPATAQALARHYAALARPAGKPSATTLPNAERIVSHGLPERKLPACASCHDRPASRTAYPRLKGQRAAYLADQLHLLREQGAVASPSRRLMARIARNIPEQEIEAIARWYAAR